jgi:hypothetical protein
MQESRRQGVAVPLALQIAWQQNSLLQHIFVTKGFFRYFFRRSVRSISQIFMQTVFNTIVKIVMIKRNKNIHIQIKWLSGYECNFSTPFFKHVLHVKVKLAAAP